MFYLIILPFWKRFIAKFQHNIFAANVLHGKKIHIQSFNVFKVDDVFYSFS